MCRENVYYRVTDEKIKGGMKMLGMMMDFLRDSIDPVFAKGMLTIYNSTTSVIMGIAAVVAIAQLFQENKDSENDKEEEKPLKRCAGELFLVVAIIFFCYGEYCKLHYYEVPNINFTIVMKRWKMRSPRPAV